MKWDLIVLAGIAAGFGAYALYLGHNTTIIASVFGFLGVIGGYIYGKKT